MLSASLKKRMPVTAPATSDRNRTPSSIGCGSLESNVCGQSKSKIVGRGVTPLVDGEAAPVPTAFTAATLKV